MTDGPDIASQNEPQLIPPAPPAPGPVWLWTTRILAAAAMGISGYLTWFSLSGDGGIPGCSPAMGFDCDHVLTSRWATWFGVPVSAFGLVAYAAAVWGLMRVGRDASESESRTAWRVLLLVAPMVGGAAAWFITLQMNALGAICIWCMAAHTCGLIVSGAILMKAPVSQIPAGKMLGAGMLGVVVLIGGQFAWKPAEYAIEQLGGATTDTGPGSDRRVSILGGKVQLPTHAFPILGSPDAPHICVYLFDYTCPHCRSQHKNLIKAVDRYAGQLGVVLLPVPLDSACNPTVEETEPRHVNACALAKLALAVWKADATKFLPFDLWLFENIKPQTLEDAQAKAQELVGAEALAAALADPWIGEQIERNVTLYKIAGGKVIPILIAQNMLITGRPASPQEMFELFETEIGLTPPAARGAMKSVQFAPKPLKMNHRATEYTRRQRFQA